MKNVTAMAQQKLKGGNVDESRENAGGAEDDEDGTDEMMMMITMMTMMTLMTIMAITCRKRKNL